MTSASGDLVPTITGYAQAFPYSVYNAKRISMSGWRWNPFGMGSEREGGWRGGRGRLLGDRGSDVRGGTVDAGYEGRARRSLKWKCHWRKVKVINEICPNYRVNSMSDAIVAARYTFIAGWGIWAGVLGLFLKDAKRIKVERKSKSRKGETVRIVQMRTKCIKGGRKLGKIKWERGVL